MVERTKLGEPRAYGYDWEPRAGKQILSLQFSSENKGEENVSLAICKEHLK